MHSLTHRIEDHPDNECQALDQVVAQARLLVQLGIWKNGGGMDDGEQSREARRNERGEPKHPPSTALELRAHDDNG
jgi:hypothetical protein